MSLFDRGMPNYLNDRYIDESVIYLEIILR